jgi:hypothetical protein
VTGGTGTITYSIKAGGSIDSGLTFNTADGSISGTPALIGTYTYTIVATDSVLATAESAPLSMTINALPVITSSGVLAQWTVNTAGYSEQITWTDGTAPFAWSWVQSSGYMTGTPPGLNLNSATGLISGTPTATGLYYIDITLTDAALQTNTLYAVIQINLPPAFESSLPDSTETVYYNHSTLASGTGTSPLTFSLDSGNLPVGTSLNTGDGSLTGLLTGDTYPATYNFTIGVVDNCGVADSQAYTVTVYELPTISPPSGVLPDATVSSYYTQTFTASGGRSPLSFTGISGTVPDGLSFDAGTGVLDGTPTTPGGPDTLYIYGVDLSGATFYNTYDLTVL